MKTKITQVKWEDMKCDYPDGSFPHGTSLKFEDDMAESLGVGNLKAGQLVEVKALAFVKEVSEESEDGKEVSKELELQLVEIDLKKAPKSRVKELYG